jgi:TetR/AcrR family transcriptional regulator
LNTYQRVDIVQGMARPRADAHARPTTERILDAALAEFANRGFGPARLEDISKAASIRRPSLLYHFGSKEKLYEAVVRRTFAELREALAAAMGDGARGTSLEDSLVDQQQMGDGARGTSFEDSLVDQQQRGDALSGESFAARIDAIVDAYRAFLETHPHFAPLMLREILDGQGPGRELITAEIPPLLDALDAYVSLTGGEELRPGVPPRAAILQLATAELVRQAAGPLRDPLWGPDEPLLVLIRALLLRSPQGSSEP